MAPDFGEEYDLLQNAKIRDGIRRPELETKSSSLPTGVFGRLIAAGKRLMVVIEHNRGGANKDLARFADQINALCEKWNR